MTPGRSVRITCFQDGAAEPLAAAATVCIDVFRATTTAVTAVVAGRRCFPAGSLEQAVPLAAALHQPLLVGELGGNMPYGFDLQNSPAAVAGRPDVWRPAILLSTSGTPLLIAAARTGRAYAACLRNWTAAADAAAAASPRVEVVGARAGRVPGGGPDLLRLDRRAARRVRARVRRCGHRGAGRALERPPRRGDRRRAQRGLSA